MLHQVLRVKMRAGIVFRARGVDDCQMPVIVGALERREERMEAESVVERNRIFLGYPNARTAAVVVVVIDRRHEREAVGRTLRKITSR